MEIKALSDLLIYQGQFLRLSSEVDSIDMLGYLDRSLSVSRLKIVLLFYPFQDRDRPNIGPLLLEQKTLKERSIRVELLNPLEVLTLKMKLESKEAILTDHSDSETIRLLNRPVCFSKL